MLSAYIIYCKTKFSIRKRKYKYSRKYHLFYMSFFVIGEKISYGRMAQYSSSD